MKIYLLDHNVDMAVAWAKYFFKETDVHIVCDDFANFMKEHLTIDGIVSPGNSFGLMDGGYDKAITNYFGKWLMRDVQKAILEYFGGEQSVGTCLTMTTPITNMVDDKILLLHTPTMRTPEKIYDIRVIYQCMREALIAAKHSNRTEIVIPAFGAGTGGVPYDDVARMMFLAYKQIKNPLRVCKAQSNLWDDDWQTPFSKVEFDKIVLPFCVKKEKSQNNNRQLIYVSSARIPHHQILKKIKGDIGGNEVKWEQID